MKRQLVVSILIILMLLLSACSSESEPKLAYKVPIKAPELDIIISSSDPAISFSEVVPSIILLNVWDKAIYDRLSSMQAINKMYEDDKPVPVGKEGDRIVIDFGQYKPDSVKLEKQYRVSNEKAATGNISVSEVELVSEKPTIFIYKIPENEEDALTNQYVFTLTADWGDNSADYAFCVEVRNNEE